jgi:tetratricopeptide (TPR) repeat protein
MSSSKNGGSASDEWRRPQAGDLIGGRYLLRRLLGRGSFAEVWEGEDKELSGRLVALKHIGNATDSEVIAYFQREMELLARINHPNVVKLFHTLVDHGRHWMVQELLTGGSLDQRLRGESTAASSGAKRALLTLPHGASAVDTHDPAKLIASVFVKLAQALAAVHEMKITHRDIKPANIMFRADGEPVLIDFGLARAEGSATLQGTQLGAPGSLAWQTPEIIEHTRKNAHFDPPADVWALGLTLYQCLTRLQPFSLNTDAATRDAVLNLHPVDPWKLTPHLPRDLGIIALATLDKNLDKRLKNAANLADDLQRFLDGRPIRSRPPSLFGKLGRFVRRQKPLAALLALCVIVPVVGAGAWLWYAPRIAAAEAEELRNLIRNENLAGFEEYFDQRYAESLGHFESVLALDETDPEALCGKVMTLNAQGRHRDRTAFIQRALGPHAEQAALGTEAPKALRRTPLLRVFAQDFPKEQAEAWVRKEMEAAHTATDWFLLVQALRADSSPSAIALRAECGHRILLVAGEPSALHLIAAVWSAGLAGKLDDVRDADLAIRNQQHASSEAVRESGVAFARCGQLDEALARLEEATRMAPERPSIVQGFAHWKARAGQGEDARALLSRSINKWPHHVGLHLELAAQLEDLEDLEPARKVLDHILTLEPKNEHANAAHARVSALIAIQKKTDLELNNPDSLVAAAIQLRRTDPERSILLLERALKISPDHPRALRETMVVLLQEKRYADAQRLEGRAVAAAARLNPAAPRENALILSIRSDCLNIAAWRGDVEAARQQCAELVRLAPQQPYHRLNLASLHLRCLEPLKTLEVLKDASQRGNLARQVLHTRGQAELALGRWQDATNTFDAEVQLSSPSGASPSLLKLQQWSKDLAALKPLAADEPLSVLRGTDLSAHGQHAESLPHLRLLLDKAELPFFWFPPPLQDAAQTALRAAVSAADAEKPRFKAMAFQFLVAELNRIRTPELRGDDETEAASMRELANSKVLRALLEQTAAVPAPCFEAWECEQDVLSTLREFADRH